MWDGANLAPIYSTTGTSWPWAWSIIGSNQIAISQFKITQFSPPLTRTRLYFRARRTGFIQNQYNSRISFGASNGSIFANAVLDASYVWTTTYVQTASPWVQQYSSVNWNFNMLGSVGDGYGHLADELEISWFMLEIVD